jgi:bifunctional non-homologous end joining protein LigD
VSPDRVATEVDGRALSLSNLDKVLYPATGFTKAELLDYYARIAEVILPHLCDRAVTFRRFPNGVDGASFFEKHTPSHAPEWVRTITVPHSGNSRPRSNDHTGDVEYVIVDDRPTLIWAANLAAIEFHVPLWRIGDASKLPAGPDTLVFDLDPGPGTSVVECCTVANWLRAELDREGLGPVLAKTSGSKGLQLYVPLSESIPWPDERDRAHRIAVTVEQSHGDLVVTNMRKTLRERRVLIDWSQNNPAKTTVAVYSLRARDEPTVSTPVTWLEVERCAKKSDPALLRFRAADVLKRVSRDGDLFSPLAPGS